MSRRVLQRAEPWLLLLVTALLAAPVAAAQEATPPSSLLLIVDASGSMWGQIDGENKIVIARRALRELLGTVPETADLGLIAYGHRREADCSDIETLAAIGAADAASIADRVDDLNPKGRTPINASVAEAIAQVQARGEATTIVLLSDGLETCDGDACATVRAARQAGAPFVLHVVGFGIDDEDTSSLECLAQAGGGLYLPADDAQSLSEALTAVAEAPELPPGRLSVRGIADGALLDVSVQVLDAASGENVGGGRTYESAETNPRILAVPPGTYRVEATAVRLSGEPLQVFEEVTIDESGEPVELVADFSTGEVAVTIRRNGGPGDATVTFFRAGTREQVAGGRTYAGDGSRPVIERLTAGLYDIEARSVEIADTPVMRWEGVRVEPQGRSELEHEFASGTLRIGVQRSGELVDAVVAVRDPETNRQIDGNRTYTSESSNPTTFVLSPGRYLVEISAVRLEGRPKTQIEVVIEADGTIEETIEI